MCQCRENCLEDNQKKSLRWIAWTVCCGFRSWQMNARKTWASIKSGNDREEDSVAAGVYQILKMEKESQSHQALGKPQATAEGSGTPG